MNKHEERRNKSGQLKEHIENTQENMENTKDMIAQTDDDALREELKERNLRREEAIDSFQMELEDEIAYKRRQD